MARSDRRREPYFDEDPGDDLRAEPRARAQRSRKARASASDDDEPSPPRSRERRASRSFFGRLVYWALVLGLWGAIGAGGLVVYYGAQLPPIDQLAVPKRPPNIAILAGDGELLANRGDMGGAAVRLSDLPPYLPKAFVAIEDRRFYSHWGIDPLGVARALTRNILARSGVQGGSTLTQQLAKNLFLTQERTISRKIQEAILALWLEHKYTKAQILELYLNRVYFGSGAYGVEAAARRYYGHGARDVTLAEAAVLAGLMKAPSKLSPDRNPEGARERAAQVLAAMAQEGFINAGMEKVALSSPARTRRDDGAGSVNYAADYVMDALADTIGAVDEDLVVTTTLDHRLQSLAEQALKDELDKKGGKFGVSQGAVVAMDPDGSIRALVGGRDYAESQFDRAVAAKRQPGSAFKPFVYLAGLEHGLTPETVREDGPLNVKGWQPENYSREYFGPVTLTKALSLSLNTVAVRVGLEVGPRAVVRTAHRLGVASELQPNASLALGTSEVTPLELVTAYAPFANGGIGVQPHVIMKVRTADGRQLYVRKSSSNGRVVEPQYVAMMNMMMEETLLTGTARKAELPGWQAAGKTGTSQDFRDAWFIGYTSRLVTGVWLGNDDNSPTKRVSGGNLPVEIWSRFMKAAHQGEPVADLPGGAWRGAPSLPAPDQFVDSVLDFLRGGAAPREEPPPRPRVATAPPEPVAPLPRAREGNAQPPAERLDDLLPPEDIPDPALRQSPRRPPRAREERNFFEKLFGG
jgi:penicillin-binding protein 1A